MTTAHAKQILGISSIPPFPYQSTLPLQTVHRHNVSETFLTDSFRVSDSEFAFTANEIRGSGKDMIGFNVGDWSRQDPKIVGEALQEAVS